MRQEVAVFLLSNPFTKRGKVAGAAAAVSSWPFRWPASKTLYFQQGILHRVAAISWSKG